MAGELKHKDVGTQLSKTEWEDVNTHVLDAQEQGDVIYASSATQLTGLHHGTAGQALLTGGNAANPSWGVPTLTDVPKIDFTDFAEVTIATGAITVTQTCHTVDTQDDDPTDDLDTINGGTNGMIIFLSPANTARTVVLKHGTGNIYLKSGSAFPLDDDVDCVCLVCNGYNWMVIGEVFPTFDSPVDGETNSPISANWAYDHVAAADPHTGYRLESADHTHQTTGAQAGQLDHGLALTAASLLDDDHAFLPKVHYAKMLSWVGV